MYLLIQRIKILVNQNSQTFQVELIKIYKKFRKFQKTKKLLKKAQMNGPRYVQKNLANQFQKDLDYKYHQRKLQEIKTKRAKTLQSNTSSSLDLKSKQKMRFLRQQMDKLNVLNKENEVIMERLVHINQGKGKTFVQKDLTDDPVLKVLQKKQVVSDVQRQIHDQKIKEENTQLVKRLIERIQKNEQMSKEQRERAITEYLKQRKLMQKYNNYHAEPHRLNSSINENNLSTDHNEYNHQIKSNNLSVHDIEPHILNGIHNGELKLPPLIDQRGNQFGDNDTSQRSQISKQLGKNHQKNTLNNNNNSITYAGNINKNNLHAKNNNYNLDTNNAIDSTNTTIIDSNKRQIQNQNQKYEYIEQSSAMYHYEDKNNQAYSYQKSNSTNKRPMREKNALSNILQECYSKLESGKSMNNIDESKPPNIKYHDKLMEKQIQTNESQENINILKQVKNNSKGNRVYGLHSLHTQEDYEKSNSNNQNVRNLKLNALPNSNILNNLSSQTHRLPSSKNHKNNNNISLNSIQSSNCGSKVLNQRNQSIGNAISIKQKSPQTQNNNQNDRVQDYNIIAKDKNRTQSYGGQTNNGYDIELKQNYQKNEFSMIKYDKDKMMSKRQSAQIVENEEIFIEDSYEMEKSIQQEESSQHQKIEEDVQIQTDQENLDQDFEIDISDEKKELVNQSYKLNSLDQSCLSPEKQNQRYIKNDESSEQIIDEDELN